jgi:hypothetical protein
MEPGEQYFRDIATRLWLVKYTSNSLSVAAGRSTSLLAGNGHTTLTYWHWLPGTVSEVVHGEPRAIGVAMASLQMVQM